MNEKLSGEYLTDYNDVTKYLKKYATKGEKLNEVLDDLSELYSDLEAENAPLSSAHEGSAEDYAKELLENLPKKKKLSPKAITVIVAVVVFIISAVYFTTDSKMAIAYRGLERVIQKPEQYELYTTSSNGKWIELYLQKPDNGDVLINAVPWDNAPFVIENFDYSENGKIYIEGSVTSDYQGNEEGYIKIPILYPSLFFNNPQKLLDCITDYDINDFKIIEEATTGSGIGLINDHGYQIATLYDGYPTYYEVNKDGSIDFCFVYKMRENEHTEKSIKEYLLEDQKVYLYIGYVELYWQPK